MFNTAKITFKFISDTDTILRVCTWLQIIDILVKSVVNIHFVFASKNAFSVANMANTVLNSIVMLVCFFAFQKLWQSQIKHVKIYLFYSVAWRIVFHVIILNVFRVIFPWKRRNGKWWAWFDFSNKNLRHQNENTVVDSEKGLNVSLFIDVTKANQINKRKLMLCARFSNHYLAKLVDFSLIKLCVTEVTQSKLANRMAPTSVILRTP